MNLPEQKEFLDFKAMNKMWRELLMWREEPLDLEKKLLDVKMLQGKSELDGDENSYKI